MKILVIGEFYTPQYDEAVRKGFELNGFKAIKFQSSKYTFERNLFVKIQRRFLNGPNYWLLWINLFLTIAKERPEILYFRRPLEYPYWYIKFLKNYFGVFLISYMNDDPWGMDVNSHRWRYFKKNIPLYDLNCIFRKLNEQDFLKHGAKKNFLFLPYYVKEYHFTNQKSFLLKQYTFDILFIGHYENDGRMEYLNQLYKLGFKVGLFGDFRKCPRVGLEIENLLPTRYMQIEEYRNTVAQSMISLSFFSKKNRDKLTTRVFEIPMCGGLLVCERNEEVLNVFEEGKEVLCFSSVNELVSLVNTIKGNPFLRSEIIEASIKRIKKDGHEVTDRVKSLIQMINRIA